MVLYVVIVNEDLARYVFFPPYLDRTITPEEINSEILKKQTWDTSEHLGEEVNFNSTRVL